MMFREYWTRRRPSTTSWPIISSIFLTVSLISVLSNSHECIIEITCGIAAGAICLKSSKTPTIIFGAKYENGTRTARAKYLN